MNRRNFLGVAAAAAAAPAIVSALGEVTRREPDQTSGRNNWIQLYNRDAWYNTLDGRMVAGIDLCRAGKRHPSQL